MIYPTENLHNRLKTSVIRSTYEPPVAKCQQEMSFLPVHHRSSRGGAKDRAGGAELERQTEGQLDRDSWRCGMADRV